MITDKDEQEAAVQAYRSKQRVLLAGLVGKPVLEVQVASESVRVKFRGHTLYMRLSSRDESGQTECILTEVTEDP